MGLVLRRALGGLLICGLLVSALAYFTYSPYLMMTVRTGPPTTAETVSSPTPRAEGAPTPTPTPGPKVSDADQLPGPGGREAGIRLVASVGPNQVFDVTETVRLPAPVTSLSLAPPDLRAVGGDLRSAHPYAIDVVIRVNDRTVRVSGNKVRRATTVTLRRATDRFEVKYRLRDAVRVSRPSWAGRAIGAVGPLVSQVPDDLPVAVFVPGKAVSNVNCVRLPADQQTCFGGERPNIQVNQNLAYRDALVQVQLDLQLAPREGRQ
jgi:hypothetical protein